MKVSTDAAGRMRTDKWLWAARFFKMRSQATDVAECDRMQADDQGARPAKEAKIGDHVRMHAHEQQWEAEVLALAEVRGPALVAQIPYVEMDISRLKRQESAGKRRLYREPVTQTVGRSTRRDRRHTDKLDGE